jgi:hypothetical protein
MNLELSVKTALIIYQQIGRINMEKLWVIFILSLIIVDISPSLALILLFACIKIALILTFLEYFKKNK